MLVCVRWNEIAISSPSIWSTVVLHPSAGTSNRTVRQWRKELERAGTRPLSVRIDWGSSDVALIHHSVSNWLQSYFDRCSTLHLIAQPPWTKDTLLLPDSVKLRSLELLDVFVDMRDEKAATPFNVTLDLTTAERLRCLIIKLADDGNVYIAHAPVSNIVQLHLEEIREQDVANLLRELRYSLQEFTWILERHNYSRRAFRNAAIHLPHLRRLQLNGAMARYCIGSLHAPLLDELVLIDPNDDGEESGWMSNVTFVFTNVRLLYYGLEAITSECILSILPLCPNVTTLYLIGMCHNCEYDGNPGREDESSSFGHHNTSSELILTLSCSPSAQNPFHNLRQLYVGESSPYCLNHIERLLKNVHLIPGFEVYLKFCSELDFNLSDFLQLRETYPHSLFLDFSNHDPSPWNHLEETDWATSWRASFG